MIFKRHPSLKWFALTVLLPQSLLAANFTCADPGILSAAETARIHSAVFWSGAPLPGDWSTPCPITVRAASHSGGGVTQFRFEHGEVFDWSMTIEGTRDSLLNDVLPHEVDHAVRASLVRHPIERWLDEGCASLFESEQTKQELRKQARSVPGSIISDRWLQSHEYPAEPDELMAVYSVGLSLVEFLLTQKSPPALLEFQKQSGPVEQRLQSIYNLSVPQLRSRWESWRASNFTPQTVLRCGCANPQKPLLVIWTAKWCGSCQKLWTTWNSDSPLRTQILEAFHVHILDYDEHRPLALLHGIRSLPSFQTANQTIVGFSNSDTLLASLHIPPVVPSNDTSVANQEIPPPGNGEDKTDPLPVATTGLTAAEEETAADSSEIPITPSPTAVPTQDPHETAITHTLPIADSPAPSAHNLWGELLPLAFSALQWSGLLGGTAATGGLLGFGIALFMQGRQIRKSLAASRSSKTTEEAISSPFPRILEEASQLLEIRQSEGRVAVLDALRGMFLDDEITKLRATTSPDEQSVLNQLSAAIDLRVDEVAPLSTQVS